MADKFKQNDRHFFRLYCILIMYFLFSYPNRWIMLISLVIIVKRYSKYNFKIYIFNKLFGWMFTIFKEHKLLDISDSGVFRRSSRWFFISVDVILGVGSRSVAVAASVTRVPLLFLGWHVSLTCNVGLSDFVVWAWGRSVLSWFGPLV